MTLCSIGFHRWRLIDAPDNTWGRWRCARCGKGEVRTQDVTWKVHQDIDVSRITALLENPPPGCEKVAAAYSDMGSDWEGFVRRVDEAGEPHVVAYVNELQLAESDL